MAKLKKSYFCTACGNESPKWVGKCPACGEWNTYTEEIVAAKSSPLTTNNFSAPRPLPASATGPFPSIKSNEAPFSVSTC